MKIEKIIIFTVVLMLFAGTVNAFSFDSILDAFKGFFEKMFGGASPTKTVTKTIVCNPPYILVGQECCLDEDSNKICDKDEQTTTLKATTTTASPTTTVKATTTTTTTAAPTTTIKATTTTTTLAIACHEQSDCGETVTKLVCFNNDVYEQSTIPICKNAGTKEAECINKVSSFMRGNSMKEPYEDCGSSSCYMGKCVNKVPATTTTQAGATTTTQGSSFTTTTTPAGQTTTTIVPTCGDGILSWSGANPAGTEECDGVNYPCPGGLDCVDCKCEGCGNGKLETGEECDPWTKRSSVGGTYLWQGQVYSCSGQYENCDLNCQCSSNVQCSPTPPFYEEDNCENSCNSDCETCQQYQGTPCYKCIKECDRLGAGWGTSSICATCDSQHEECVESDTCDDCYHCVERCPEDTNGVDYYRFQGCDATCDTRLCVQKTQDPYKDCYYCVAPSCGDDIISWPDEECEYDSDCPDYHYCDMDCLCTPDCAGYCADQGVDGYDYVAGGPSNSKANCEAEATAQMNALKANCRAVCSAHSFMTGVNGNCCCVDADWEPCTDCPGQNPDCTIPLATCKAGL